MSAPLPPTASASGSAGRPIEGAGGRAAADAAVLSWLARCPFLSAADLALVLDGQDSSPVNRRLARLARAGLVEAVVPASSHGRFARLHYLSDAGVRALAALAGEQPAILARRWGLGEAALLRRLCRLDHLVLARGFLLDLLYALQQRPGEDEEGGAPGAPAAVLADWQAWPVRQRYWWRQRPLVLTLDGRGAVSWPRAGPRGDGAGGAAAGGASPFVLLWDDGEGISPAAVAPTLRGLGRARLLAPSRGPGGDAGATTLLVAADARRATEVWPLARAVADRDALAPLPLLITDGPRLESWGPLACLWRAEDDRWDTLLSLLARGRREVSPLGEDALRPAPHTAPQEGPDEHEPARGRAATGDDEEDEEERREARGPLVRGRFAARAGTRLTLPAGRREVALCNLALRRREVRALRCVGFQPLLTLAGLADLTGDSPRGRLPRTLARLQAAGLIAGDLPTRQTVGAWRRYVLTPAGLRVLAARAGLSPTEYAVHTGSLAGELPPAAEHGAALGAGAAPAPLASRGGRGLVWLRRYPAHTRAVQDVFVAFLHAARAAAARGEAHSLDLWRGEWAAARSFPRGGAWATLRPDAYLRYRVGARVHSFFLEVDRATSSRAALRAKLVAYHGYRASGVHAQDVVQGGLAFPTLLVVTTGEERLRHLLALEAEVAATLRDRPLALLVAAGDDVRRQGPLGAVWRAARTAPPRPLLPPGDVRPARGDRHTHGARSRAGCREPPRIEGREDPRDEREAGDRALPRGGRGDTPGHGDRGGVRPARAAGGERDLGRQKLMWCAPHAGGGAEMTSAERAATAVSRAAAPGITGRHQERWPRTQQAVPWGPEPLVFLPGSLVFLGLGHLLGPGTPAGLASTALGVGHVALGEVLWGARALRGHRWLGRAGRSEGA